MSIDPNIDYNAHDPEDGEAMSSDPRIREVQELEKKMREALATKDNPLRDDESTSDRLHRAGFDEPASAEGDPRGGSREERATEDDEQPSGE